MSYRSLLRVAGPGFFPLGFLARLPYATSALSTLILLQATTGSYPFAGLACAVQSIAVAFGGPTVGALADRYGHRPVALTAALANFAALVGLLSAVHEGGRASVLTAAGLVGLSQPQVGPLVRVRWSGMLRGRDRSHLLPSALSYEAAADELSFVAGPVMVGLLAPVSPLAPMVATAVLLVAATLPFALLRGARDLPQHKVARDGKAAPLPRRPLAAMFLAMAGMGAVFGAVQTGVTAYANGAGQPADSGFIYAELGVGSALAGVACGWLPQRFTLRRRYVTFAVLLLAGMLILLTGDRLHEVPLAMALAGITVAPYMISLYALTARLSPPGREATAMTVLCSGGPLGTAAGQASAGFLAADHGSGGAFLAASVAAAGMAALALVLLLADRKGHMWLARDAEGNSVPEVART